MTFWTSVIIVVAFSFLVIGLDELWHWRRRQRRARATGGATGGAPQPKGP
jgi:hypothetical protein